MASSNGLIGPLCLSRRALGRRLASVGAGVATSTLLRVAHTRAAAPPPLRPLKRALSLSQRPLLCRSQV